MSSKKSTKSPATKFTIKAFAERKGIDPVMANNVLMFLSGLGYVKMLDPLVKGKGRPSNVFEVPNKMTVEFCKKVIVKNMKTQKKTEGATEPVVEPIVEPVTPPNTSAENVAETTGESVGETTEPVVA